MYRLSLYIPTYLIVDSRTNPESISHYIAHGTMYNDKRHSLLSAIKNIDCKLLEVTEFVLIKMILFGNCSVDAQTNTQILKATIEYILTIKRFDESLFHSWSGSPFGFSFLYIMTRIEDKVVSGTRRFLASSFVYYYYISTLGFISILTF